MRFCGRMEPHGAHDVGVYLMSYTCPGLSRGKRTPANWAQLRPKRCHRTYRHSAHAWNDQTNWVYHGMKKQIPKYACDGRGKGART